MKLIAYAHCCVPDVEAARRVYDVEGLDDKAVAKILYHRRKQQAGSENLRPDQQRLAVVSLVHGEPEHPQLDTLSLSGHSENDMLQHVGKVLGGTGRLSGWRLESQLAVLRLRATHNGAAVPRLFTEEHQDLSATWGDESPLDEASRLMGLPGLLGTDRSDDCDAWLAGDEQALRAKAEIAAISCWQLAQRLAIAQGRLTPQHAPAAKQALIDLLDGKGEAHLGGYAAALGN